MTTITPGQWMFFVGLIWGMAIGIVLTLWVAIRYAGDLHDRVTLLEHPPKHDTPPPVNLTCGRPMELVFRSEAELFAKVADRLEADDDDEPWTVN